MDLVTDSISKDWLGSHSISRVVDHICFEFGHGLSQIIQHDDGNRFYNFVPQMTCLCCSRSRVLFKKITIGSSYQGEWTDTAGIDIDTITGLVAFCYMYFQVSAEK